MPYSTKQHQAVLRCLEARGEAACTAAGAALRTGGTASLATVTAAGAARAAVVTASRTAAAISGIGTGGCAP